MITYKAMFKYLDDSVHAEVLNFPGVITSATDIDGARLQLASALTDMAKTSHLKGEALPTPNTSLFEADIEEPILLC